jgi:hypothetical protein
MTDKGLSSKWLPVVAGMVIVLLSAVSCSFADLLRADINRDGRIDSGDMSILHGEMGRENCTSSPCQADLNGDGRVNGDDLEILTDEVKSGNRAAGEMDAPAEQSSEPEAEESGKLFFDRKPPEQPPVDAGEEEESEGALQPASGRFTDNKDGTVTDTETGLMWTKNGDLTGDTMLFHQALNYIADMNRGKQPNFGFTDWRLPTLAELRSLVDYTKLKKWEHTVPDGHPFENVQSLKFNSTAYLNDVEHSWFVSLYCRLVGHNVDSCYGHVWAVRGGGGSGVMGK